MPKNIREESALCWEIMPLMLLVGNNVKTEGGAFWKESYYFFTRKNIYPLPWHYTHYRQWNIYLWNVQIFKDSRGYILFAYKFSISNTVVVAHSKCWKGAANAKNPANEGRAPTSCPKAVLARDFPGGPMAKTLHSQCWGPGFNPWSGKEIPHAATKSSHAPTKDPMCHN